MSAILIYINILNSNNVVGGTKMYVWRHFTVHNMDTEVLDEMMADTDLLLVCKFHKFMNWVS